MAIWAAGGGVVWASNGRHNEKTSSEQAKVFMTAKSTTDCSTALLNEGEVLLLAEASGKLNISGGLLCQDVLIRN
jgi:hypothetical protein